MFMLKAEKRERDRPPGGSMQRWNREQLLVLPLLFPAAAAACPSTVAAAAAAADSALLAPRSVNALQHYIWFVIQVTMETPTTVIDQLFGALLQQAVAKNRQLLVKAFGTSKVHFFPKCPRIFLVLYIWMMKYLQNSWPFVFFIFWKSRLRENEICWSVRVLSHCIGSQMGLLVSTLAGVVEN